MVRRPGWSELPGWLSRRWPPFRSSTGRACSVWALARPDRQNSLRGLILNPGTLPGWVDVPIADYLAERFQAPACLENDADAAALGEYWMGAGRGVSRLYAVTVGTGIGTACILDGGVYRGQNGFHPEGGHQIVDPTGPECYCGGKGCWESWASGTAIADAARRALSSWQAHTARAGRRGSIGNFAAS